MHNNNEKKCLTSHTSLFGEIPLIHEKGLRIYKFLIYENFKQNRSLKPCMCRSNIVSDLQYQWTVNLGMEVRRRQQTSIGKGYQYTLEGGSKETFQAVETVKE